MARTDRKKKGGRVTPKGGGARPVRGTRHDGAGPPESGRYTAPIPVEQRVSPLWVPVLMFGLLALGLVVIFLNYLGVLPGGTDNRYLLVGLGAILGGIITATNFH